MLNIIWICFFLAAFVTALFKLIFLGDQQVFAQIMEAMFSLSKSAFEISLGLTGVLALWLGIMRIGEKSGFIQLLTQSLTPLFSRLMPDVPRDHPALGAIVMNISANALGLDNAATPLGIKAMKELQTLNPTPETASNAQILFLVINTSGVTLFPVTIFTYRAQLGAANPTDVFIPILIATYMSTLAGLLAVAAVQKINLLDKVIVAYLGGFTLVVGGLLAYFSSLPQEQMLQQSATISNVILFSLVIIFILGAINKGINAYDAFIDGAKEGFQTAITIIPYLVAMLVAIGVFRASGALDLLADLVRFIVHYFMLDDRFVDALAHRLNETVQRQRRQSDDDRYDENHGGRFVCRTLIVHRTRQHGNHLLCTGHLLWLGGYQTYSSCRNLWDNSRFWRHYCRNLCRLLVLWMIE